VAFALDALWTLLPDGAAWVGWSVAFALAPLWTLLPDGAAWVGPWPLRSLRSGLCPTVSSRTGMVVVIAAEMGRGAAMAATDPRQENCHPL